MKKSRTSTNKKSTNKPKNNIRKKNSASPASARPKKVVAKTNSTVKKAPPRPPQNQSPRPKVKKVNNTNVNNDDIIKFNPERERKYMAALGEEPKKQLALRPEKKETKKLVKPTTVLKFVFFIAILAACGYLMFSMEVFNLDNINVEGNQKYTRDEIVSASTLSIGENVFIQLIRNSGTKLPYINTQHYKYTFPSTITIQVEERAPMYFALDKNKQLYYKIDNEGYILEECQLDKKGDCLLVEGIAFTEEVTLGTKIDDVYMHKLDTYNDIKKELESNGIVGNITRVNFANSLTIVTLDDKLNIVFANDSNFKYKITFLKEIIQRNGGSLEGTIDMSIENPVYSKYD